MLIRFKVANFRSIKEEQEISFVAPNANFKKLKENYFEYKEGSKKILLKKVIALYGANASGKSNVVKAFIQFKNIVANSTKFDINKPIVGYNPFLLDENSKNQPTIFEFSFVFEGTSYRYGFSYNKEAVEREYLYQNIFKAEKLIFERDRQDFTLGAKTLYSRDFDRYEGQLKKQVSRKELLLSREARNEHELMLKIQHFILNNDVFPANSSPGNLTKIICEKSPEIKSLVQKMVTLTDYNIIDFLIAKNHEFEKAIRFVDDFPEELKRQIIEQESLGIRTKHQFTKNDGTSDEIEFDYEQESDGTRKFIDFACVLLLALRNARICIFDELNSSFHPALTRFIIDLFHGTESNPNNAQMLFTTHDTEFIDLDIFRPDQIYFVEKDRKTQASVVYSLADFELPKGKTKFEDWYLSDRFGAVPAIGFFVLPEEFRKDKKDGKKDE